MSNENARAAVGLERLAVWPVTKNTSDELTFGEVHELKHRLMAMTSTPKVVSGVLNADDMPVENVTETQGCDIDLDVTALNSEERVLFYGETLRNGTNVRSTSDTPGLLVVACMTKRADGLYNLKKYMAVKFIEQAQTNNTVELGNIKYDTIKLKGECYPPLKLNEYRYVRFGVDLVKDADIVTKWFTEAEYIGPEDTATTQTTSTDTGEDG